MEWPDDTPLPPNLTSILAATVGHLERVVVRSWDDPTFRVLAIGYTTDDDVTRPSRLDNSMLLSYYDHDERCWAVLFTRPR